MVSAFSMDITSIVSVAAGEKPPEPIGPFLKIPNAKKNVWAPEFL